MYFSGDTPSKSRSTKTHNSNISDCSWFDLADLPRNIMLNNDELEFEQAQSFS